MNKKNFDLTTVEGMQIAKGFISKVIFNTPLYRLLDMGKRLIGSEATKEQGEVVRKLIKEGKEKGVDEMEIVVDNIKGINLGIPIEGTDIKLMAGNNENSKIKVKYKK